MNRILTAVLVLGLMFLLTSCTTGSSPVPTPTSTEEALPTEPTLRVPPEATGSSVLLQVSGGHLPAGTPATIYRFDSRWDTAAPTCTDSKAETFELTLNGDGKWQQINVTVIPGITHWVLVAGDYASPCGDPNAQTLFRVETQANVFTGDPTAQSRVGESMRVDVEITSPPTPEQITGTVLILGPWRTVPEAQAVNCKAASVAFRLPLTIDYGGVSPRGTVEFTPTTPGTYVAIVQTKQTGQSTALDTCETGETAVFTVAAN